MEFEFGTGVAIFIVYLVIDAFYALYTRAVNSSNAIRAATIGAAMHFMLAYGIVSYNKNWLYIFPLALGSWIGTWYIVWRETKKKKPDKFVKLVPLLKALEKRGITISAEELAGDLDGAAV